MDLNFFEELADAIQNTIKDKKIKSKDLSDDEIELAQKLNAIEEFTVDRIEGDKVVLENRQKQEMISVDIKQLPEEIKSGDILKKINGKYILDLEMTEQVSERIKDKMDNLWNN